VRLRLTVITSVLVALVVLIAVVGLWLWTPDRDRATLESRYARGPGDFIDAAGIRLHVRDDGSRMAPVVILLHGFGSSLHTWEPWAQVLARDYRVVRFDLPGAGLSAPDPTGDYTDARSLQVLSALMDRLGVSRTSLIGNSIGGRIAWKFAATYPARVDKLVLISPDGFASPGFEYGKKPDIPAVLGLMRYALPEAVLRMNLKPAYADQAALTDALVTRYHHLLLAPGIRDAMIARMAQTILQDPVPMLRRIDAPTLLLWGDKDAMIPPANAQDYLRALPHGTLVSLAGLGHVPHEEAPARSLEPVADFLKR
jgi:pimeloyl-ACP methyl ester carboxylesterase